MQRRFCSGSILNHRKQDGNKGKIRENIRENDFFDLTDTLRMRAVNFHRYPICFEILCLYFQASNSHCTLWVLLLSHEWIPISSSLADITVYKDVYFGHHSQKYQFRLTLRDINVLLWTRPNSNAL